MIWRDPRRIAFGVLHLPLSASLSGRVLREPVQEVSPELCIDSDPGAAALAVTVAVQMLGPAYAAVLR